MPDIQNEEEAMSDGMAAEDPSNLANQPNSLVSPESLLDNILSGASSISVRSSSLSSNSGVAGGLGGTASTTQKGSELEKGRIRTNSVEATSATKSVLSNLLKNNSTKTNNVNCSLNPRTPLSEVKSSVPSLKLLQSVSPKRPAATSSKLDARLAAETTLSQITTIRSRMPSATRNGPSSCTTADRVIFAEDLKCQICFGLFRDPRSLNCLHSFCFECIVNENYTQDASIPFWSQPLLTPPPEWRASSKSNGSTQSSSPEAAVLRSSSDVSTSPSIQRRSSFSFKRKKSSDKLLLKDPSESGALSDSCSSALRSSCVKARDGNGVGNVILCKICQFPTELPVGGIRQLPQNSIIVRKVKDLLRKGGEDEAAEDGAAEDGAAEDGSVSCHLCFEVTAATYHCTTCSLNLCSLCKEAHERQRNTTTHRIRNIVEPRNKVRTPADYQLVERSKRTLKCAMHPGFEVNAFCSTCLQVACPDCLVLLHKGHKHETVSKAVAHYTRILRDSVDQTRPLCIYGEHSIERLNEIAKNVNRKCDQVQSAVEAFMSRYFEAVEVHRQTLLQQVRRARETKMEMILEQQLAFEKRTEEAMMAVRFSQELMEMASDVGILSFVNILLKRFEYCRQFKMPVDPKISDSLHFLPQIRAPSMKDQNDIPLFGIITMQTVEPSLCTLRWEGFSQLRLHKRVELTVLTRDADGVALCHGGLRIESQLKYKEYNSKLLPLEVSDHRDGTYTIAFTPDSQGTILLTVTINEKPIKGSPFTFLARAVRPHGGIYHCCSFCSSKGTRTIKCSCDCRMPGYAGCGHGHAGHPGRRHWSCCGNVLENSECSAANNLLNL